MPSNAQIQYTLQAQSNLAAVIKADAAALQQLATAGNQSQKELVASMNASTRAAGELRKELGQLDSTTKTLATSSKSAAVGHQSLLTSIAGGVAVGNLAAAAIRVVGGAVLDMGKNAISAAGDFEQSKISFTTFLGSAPAMKTFLADLQQFANVSPFQFGDLQNDAKYLLAMGIAGQDVLPVLKDVSAAVAASGGGAEALANVSAAYAKINAEGKTSAIYLNEITRNGVPAFQMLAESMGVTVAQVRELASNGEITAATFDKAFNAYTVAHYGDMLAQQSRTFKGLQSTIEDVGGSFERALGGPIIAAIEPELAKLTDELTKPEVAATLAEWGTNLGKAAFAATQLWDNVSAGARAAFTVVKPVFDAIGQLLGSLPDAPTLPDPVAGVAKSTADLNTQIDLSATKTNDYKEEIQAAQDTLTAMRRTQQDQSYATDTAIQQERTKLSVLQEQWAVQDQATSITRLQAKIAKDTLLAKDLYSSAGQAAGKRLVDEQQQLADMQVKAGRDGQKRQLDDKISGLEGQKRAQDHAAQQAQNGIQDEITGYQRRAAAEKKAADDAKKATDAKALADKAAAAAAAQLARDQDTLFAKLQLLDYGTTTGATQTNGLAGAFDALNERIKAFAPLQGAANDAQREWNTLTANAPKQLDEMSLAVKDLAATLGVDKGLDWIVQAVKDDLTVLFDTLVIGAPVLLKIVGGAFGEITDDLKLLGDQAKIGMLNLQALLNGGQVDQKAMDAATSKMNADAAASNTRRQAFVNSLNETMKTAAEREATQIGTDTQKSTQLMVGILAGPQSPTTHAAGITSGGGFAQTGAQGLARDEMGRPLPHRASGGPVSAGSAYTVGERGPETFVPSSNGAILPNGAGQDISIEVKHLCPACLETSVERIIRRRGSQLVARSVMGAMG